MSLARVFSFESHQVRVIEQGDEPWWVAQDVSELLGISRTDDAVSRLDDDEKGTATIRTPGGAQEMTVINESGLYSLILTSRKPDAKRFKRWVTREVIPAIRKTGGYFSPAAHIQPVNADSMATLLARLDSIEGRIVNAGEAIQPGPLCGIKDMIRQAWPRIDDRSARRIFNAVWAGVGQKGRQPVPMGTGQTFQYGIHLGWDSDVFAAALLAELRDWVESKVRPLLPPEPTNKRKGRRAKHRSQTQNG